MIVKSADTGQEIFIALCDLDQLHLDVNDPNVVTEIDLEDTSWYKFRLMKDGAIVADFKTR